MMFFIPRWVYVYSKSSYIDFYFSLQWMKQVFDLEIKK